MVGHRRKRPGWARLIPIFDPLCGGGWRRRLGDQPEVMGEARRLGARTRLQFGQDGGDMVLDRLGRGGEAVGDLAVAQPLGEQEQDLELAWGEASGIGLGGGTGTTWQPTNARLP